jgi:DNA-binding response OmpR family regulator
LILAADFVSAERLSRQLLDCGYSCAVARRSEGLKAASESEPDFVVFDHDASDFAGWSLLARLPEVTDAPIIILADESIAGPTVEALRLGAAALLQKPVDPEELCLRVAVALRGAVVEPREASGIGDEFFQVDLAEKSASVLGLELDLGPTELRLLAAFATHREVAMSHDRILGLVWPDGFRERTMVKLYVSNLRRSVREVAPMDPVVTLSGIGYRYEPRRTD